MKRDAGDLTAVKAALEVGARPDGRPTGSPTPLIAAAQAVPAVTPLLTNRELGLVAKQALRAIAPEVLTNTTPK